MKIMRTRVDHLLPKGGENMAKLLYIATHGTDDPTRATLPFLMAKGALDAGHETGVMLMGEAAPLIKDHIARQVQGIGVPALKELMDILVSKDVRISV
jgi:predicted peroxiredoxin